jgi:SagB-type dehydrogenase family enzyme
MNDIMLAKPNMDLEYPLIKALDNRRTKRKWKKDLLSLYTISNLLWSTCGETFEATSNSKNRRTIPSACNSQIINIYIALDTGVYKYIEKEHKLKFLISEDIRDKVGTQNMMKSAPFGIIYVADFSRKTGIFSLDENKKMIFAATECGSMIQNVYLYCAATSLNTVVLGLVDREKLSKYMKLDENKKIIYTQIVGKSI